MNDRPRIANVSARAHCEWCEDGLAVNAYRPIPNRPEDPGLPEYAPCPWCERGAALEFPTGAVTKPGYRPALPSWGADGYWQGRATAVERAPVHASTPLPLAENLRRMKLLTRRFGGRRDVDPAVGVLGSDPAARLALLALEEAK